MAKTILKKRIRQGLFLLDGAMGTQLIARGIDAGGCSDYLNIASPDTVFEIHKSYADAGSNAILTNTFGANSVALARHGHSDKVEKINVTAAKIARRAAGAGKYVLGDIGPSGDFLEPLGRLKVEELKEAFAQQVKALLAGGVDGFIIETMTAIEELAVTIEAVKSVGGELPIFASMAFDRAGAGFRTMMGVDVASAVSKMLSLGVDAVGFNCGSVALNEYVKLADEFVFTVKQSGADVVMYGEPNAGGPELVDGKAVYRVSPDEFAATAEKIYSAGVKIIGGCCGTGPEHIAAMAGRLKKLQRSRMERGAK
jgi:5-methyltetrahydrofolate--homocysteine methyltransferase